MKIFFGQKVYRLALLLFVASCGEASPSGCKPHQLNLVDGEFSIKLDLPEIFDTVTETKGQSDTYCGDTDLTVFMPNQFRPTYDSLLNHLSASGPLCNIVIAQPFQSDCQDPNLKIDQDFLDKLIRAKNIGNSTINFLVKEVRHINDQKYVIIASKSILQTRTNFQLLAITELDQKQIRISYNCVGCNYDDFQEMAFESINSLKINMN